mgnify:FL=1
MSLFSPFKVFGKFQPVDEPEDCCAVILNGDFLNQLAEQRPVKGHQQIRPFFQNVQKFLRALDRLIVLGAQNVGFLQLCLAALFSQLVAAGYKNVRIDDGLLLELGQRNRS